MSNENSESSGLDSAIARRLEKALNADSDELFAVLQDPSPDVLKAAIRNPLIKEAHLLAVLKRRDLNAEVLKAVANSKVLRESHTAKRAIASHPSTTAAQLSELIPHLYLFDLAVISTLPGGSQDQKMAAERAIIQRLPSTPVGNKITLAHKATSGLAEHLMREADPRIMSACLDNPHLKEGTIFQFLRSAAANSESISMIARHPRWGSRPSLRLAILTNPRTPLVWFTQWLHGLNSHDVRNIYSSQRLSQMQRREVLAELERRGLH